MGKVLINKKTGKEVHASDPDAVLAKHPKTFTVKPATVLAKDVIVKEAVLVDSKPEKRAASRKADQPKDKE